MNVHVAPNAATLLSPNYRQYLLTLTPNQRALVFRRYSAGFEIRQPGPLTLDRTTLGGLVHLEPTLESEITAAFYKNCWFDWNACLRNQVRDWRIFQRATLPMIHHLIITFTMYEGWWDPDSELRGVVDMMARKTELHNNGRLNNWSLRSLTIRGVIPVGRIINNWFHFEDHLVRRLRQSGVAVIFHFAYCAQ